MAKRSPSLTADEAASFESSVETLTQEIRVLRQAIDEFRDDFVHALRNLPDNLQPPYQHLTTLGESFALERQTLQGQTTLGETLCCYECEAESPPSLAKALHDGWIDIGCAEEAHGTAFVGWCPACQRAHDDEQQRLNQPTANPPPVPQTAARDAVRRNLFD